MRWPALLQDLVHLVLFPAPHEGALMKLLHFFQFVVEEMSAIILMGAIVVACMVEFLIGYLTSSQLGILVSYAAGLLSILLVGMVSRYIQRWRWNRRQ